MDGPDLGDCMTVERLRDGGRQVWRLASLEWWPSDGEKKVSSFQTVEPVYR